MSTNYTLASDVPGNGAGPGTGCQPTDDDRNRPGNRARNLAVSALAETDSATTAAGNPRQRMKWDMKKNMAVMRCYFKATNIESNTSAYRTSMYRLFKAEYPNLDVTEQRVADQRRTIVHRKLLADEIIEEVKDQVRKELNQANEDTASIDSDNTREQEGEAAAVDQTDRTPSDNTLTYQTTVTDEPEHRGLKEELELYLLLYQGTDPTQRPFIPRLNSSAKLSSIVHSMNSLLPDFVTRTESFVDLHALIYCAALVCAKQIGARVDENGPSAGQVGTGKPCGWRRRLECKVATLRGQVNRLTQFKQGHRSRRQTNAVNRILRDNKRHTRYEEDNLTVDEVLDTLKQKLTAVAKRLRRYVSASQRRFENRLFREREGKFYRLLQTDRQGTLSVAPSREDIHGYWSQIWSGEVTHGQNAAWIDKERQKMEHVEAMRYTRISHEEFVSIVNKTHNWKASGCDHLHNYWLKKFTSIHTRLLTFLNKFIEDPDTMPRFLTKGVTFLIPKKGDTRDPANYRPITCLPTVYKILTACISHQVYSHCDRYNILAEQQKGCRKYSQGCKEQLLIDLVVMKQAYKTNRNIYTAYIDYRKAFDSIPHSWLLEVLKIYKVNPTLIQFLQTALVHWEVTLKLRTTNVDIATGPIRIRRGIFQGDSLSPLWFCLALNPLSNMLNERNGGYGIVKTENQTYRLTHLLYMDDLKIYSSTAQQLKQNLTLVEMFSNDIRMSFGLEKCRTQCINRGKREVITHELESHELIDCMQEGDTYKYLGIKQSRLIEQSETKDRLLTEYLDRVRRVTRTKLLGKNMVKAINTYAIPLLAYSFGVIDWTDTDIRGIQRKTSRILTNARLHHPKSAVERLTLPRSEGGRGITDIRSLLLEQKKLLREYFIQREPTSMMHRAIVYADKNYSPLNLSGDDIPAIVTNAEKRLSWSQKALHGKHAYELSQPHIDRLASNTWLTQGQLFPETEGFMCAIQDQVICTKNYRKHIIRDGTENDSCRRCGSSIENIQHIISGCQVLTQHDYKNRHDNVAKILHQAVAHKYTLLNDRTPYYKYIPSKVLESDTVRLYWDRGIITDRTISHNRPDITLIDKGSRTAYLIDVSVPNSGNIQTAYAEKLRKYADLGVEVQQQWQLEKVYTLPVIISATGVIPRSLLEALDRLNLPQTLHVAMQKSVILDTCSTVRKFLGDRTYTQ